jgi:hypothetical protein
MKRRMHRPVMRWASITTLQQPRLQTYDNELLARLDGMFRRVSDWLSAQDRTLMRAWRQLGYQGCEGIGMTIARNGLCMLPVGRPSVWAE